MKPMKYEDLIRDMEILVDGLNNGIEILKAQSARDYVKVCRCEECAYWEGPDGAPEDGGTVGHCRNKYSVCNNQQTDITWFCADGDRSEAHG